MTKHRQTRKRNRNQKGGAWYNPLTWGQQDPYAPKKSWGEWFSGTSNNVIQGADNAVGSAANAISSGVQNAYTNVVSSITPVSQQSDVQTLSTDSSQTMPSQSTAPVSSNSSVGGKRRKRSRRMKGGYGYKENLAYYAAPVQGLDVARPTYWVTSKTNAPLSGGSKRRLKRTTSRRK